MRRLCVYRGHVKFRRPCRAAAARAPRVATELHRDKLGGLAPHPGGLVHSRGRHLPVLDSNPGHHVDVAGFSAHVYLGHPQFPGVCGLDDARRTVSR